MFPARGGLPSFRFVSRRQRRWLHASHAFADLVGSQLATQVYVSTSHNPFFNLALEHHLFSALPAHSRTLLLYRNAPCIVIGRNQNPWLETHHPLLLAAPSVSLLRRRSGGGTVFHDLGNTNYSVTVPTAVFDRDKHACLMVRVLRLLGVNAAVNKRHDIVVLPAAAAAAAAAAARNMHENAAEKLEHDAPGALKCSGSAYKITRLRSYHHGTMLLNTDLSAVSRLLASPASSAITARGVASVRSPVANTRVAHADFVDTAIQGFLALYPDASGVCCVGEEDSAAAGMDAVRRGMDELCSPGWVYGQTPKFEMQLGIGVRLVVEKGIVAAVEGARDGGGGEGVVGARFGGGVVERCLIAGGVPQQEASHYAASTVGARAWGEM